MNTHGSKRKMSWYTVGGNINWKKNCGSQNGESTAPYLRIDPKKVYSVDEMIRLLLLATPLPYLFYLFGFFKHSKWTSLKIYQIYQTIPFVKFNFL